MTQRFRHLSLFCMAFILAFTASYAQSWGDYTLIAVQNQTTAKLIDNSNATYHTWTLTGSTAYSSYLLPGGVLLRTVSAPNSTFTGGGMTGRVQKVDWNGTILWDYTYSTSTYNMHHDICPMPNGNVLVISYELKTATDATAAGCSQAITIWSEKIVELEPVGTNGANIVWEWHLWDHLVQNANPTKNNYQTSISDHPELMNINFQTQKDWFHMNGIDYNPTLNQIVFSSHNMNQLFVIDHSTTSAEAASHSGGNSGKGGDFLYRWGNPTSYGMTGTTNFSTVHDAHFVPNDCPKAGYIVGYNNNGISTSKSCVDMVAPPYNGYNYSWTAGSAYAPATYTYRHPCNGHNSNMGNSQSLPNGNLLVCIAQSGKVYEVDSLGNQVWTYTTTGTIPQAFRYSSCYVNGNPSAVVAASLPTICEGNSTQLNTTASNGTNFTYNWSSSPAGFSSTLQNPTVSPSQTTTYTVIVSAGACSDTATTTVTVNALPATPSISQNGNVLTSSAATGNQWYLNGNIIAGATGQTYTPTQSGNYTVQVTENSCSSTISTAFPYAADGIEDINNDNLLSVAPNPTTGMLVLKGSILDAAQFEVVVFDGLGKKVLQVSNSKTLDLSGLKNGIYHISIQTEKGSVNRKVCLIQ